MSYYIKIIRDIVLRAFSLILRILPIQRKVVALAYRGKVYGDNPRYIMEALLDLGVDYELIWQGHSHLKLNTPLCITLHDRDNIIRTIYDYATARVIINMEGLPIFVKKRNGQVIINTWHGGLGIKKIGTDIDKGKYNKKFIKHNNYITDVFLSNSNHLSRLYREAFGYNGPIWKCGFPKNDMLINDKTLYRANIRKKLNLHTDCKILLYAPTFRDYVIESDPNGMSFYDVDFSRLRSALIQRFGGEWIILFKYHPRMQDINMPDKYKCDAINVSKYPDMQSLIMASDILISDYSSCIFDAATMSLDCFIFATDFERYKNERGVYYDLDELPFPYASDNDELEHIILNYDQNDFKHKWHDFTIKMGLVETGHASKDVALKIKDILDGKKVVWENTDI